MLETAKAIIERMLEGATDPEAIRAYTELYDDVKKSIEEGKRKDDLISRQAGDIKRLYLNDTPATPSKEDGGDEPPKGKYMTFEEIVEKNTQEKSK